MLKGTIQRALEFFQLTNQNFELYAENWKDLEDYHNPLYRNFK